MYEGYKKLNTIVPKSYFQLWIEALVTMPKGKKPPLRTPFIYKNGVGKFMLAKM